MGHSFKPTDVELIELRNIKIVHKIFLTRLEMILSDITENNKIIFRRNPEARLKTTASILKNYILSANSSMEFIPFVSQMPDIAGLRLTITTKDEFEIAKKILASSKKLKNYGTLDTKTRKKNGIMNKRGYAAHHYYIRYNLNISCNDDKLKEIIENTLIEANVDRHELGDEYPVVAEIQIRTLAQDLWAVFEHPERYKGSGEIPQSLNEELLNYAKLMNVADDIAQLTKNRKIYEAQEYFTKKRTAPTNGKTLLDFKKLKTTIDKYLAKAGLLGSVSTYDLCTLLVRLANQGIFTTDELNDLLKNKIYMKVVDNQFELLGIIRKRMKISLLDNIHFLFCCRQCQIELENIHEKGEESLKMKERETKKRDAEIHKKILELKSELDFETNIGQYEVR